MKKNYLFPIILLLIAYYLPADAQDVPLFTQKLTNAFLYNPSVAGNSLGSLTFSHRQNWNSVLGAPTTNFLSLHTPFAKGSFGTGLNVYQENIGVYQTLSVLAAFSYHIKITDTKTFSMGVSGEYANLKIDATRLDVEDITDEVIIANSSTNQMDFSFGMTYRTKYLTVGATANRLRNSIQKIADTKSNFPGFYTGYFNGRIPLRNGKDLLEPVVTYRSYVTSESQLDAGLYYTYNSALILGGSYRTGHTASATLGVRVKDRYLLGYTRDLYTADYGSQLGSSNEITLRIDFKSQEYYTNKKHARVINTQALAVHRKTLAVYKGSGSGSKKSKRYKKILNRNYQKSPNYRMNSSKKLQTVKLKKGSRKKR